MFFILIISIMFLSSKFVKKIIFEMEKEEVFIFLLKIKTH